MNERIIKLITKADTHAWSIADKYAPDCGEVNYLWEDAFRKKFAELIVADCAEFVQFYYKDHMCEVIAYDMKQHFGVEE